MISSVVDTLVVVGMAVVQLGTVQESDGIQEHTFRIVNAGEHSLVLEQGYTSCHCTTMAFEKGRTLLSGDTTTVKLSFNPQGKGGEFYESGTVVYGDRKRLTVALEGECITSEETLLRQFPVRLSDDVRLSTDHYDLGIVHVGETKERSVVVLHRDEDNRQEVVSVTFTATEEHKKGVQQVICPVVVTHRGKEVSFDVRLDVWVK